MTTAHDFGLNQSLVSLKKKIHTFCRDKIAPIAQSIDKTNQFPRQLWPQLGHIGVFSITVTKKDGGSNLGHLAHIMSEQKSWYIPKLFSKDQTSILE